MPSSHLKAKDLLPVYTEHQIYEYPSVTYNSQKCTASKAINIIVVFVVVIAVLYTYIYINVYRKYRLAFLVQIYLVSGGGDGGFRLPLHIQTMQTYARVGMSYGFKFCVTKYFFIKVQTYIFILQWIHRLKNLQLWSLGRYVYVCMYVCVCMCV